MDNLIASFTGLQSMTTLRNELSELPKEARNKELIRRIHMDALKSFGYMVSYFFGTLIAVVAIKLIL